MIKALFAVSIVALIAGQASATVFWDTNGATAGSGGPSPSGTWSNAAGDTNWTTSSTGVTATTAYGTDKSVQFAAGTDATSAYTVTVVGTVDVLALRLDEGGTPTFTGGTINFTADATGGATSVLTTVSASTTNAVFDSVVSGTKGLRVARNLVTGGVLTLNNTGNTITGGLFINSGNTIRLGASGVVPDSNIVSFNNAAAASTFDVNGQTETIASLTATAATAAVTLGNGTLTVATPTGQTFAGVISGTGGSFVKNGNGTLILTGQNTYTGTTTIGAGTLQVGNNTTTGQLAGSSGAIINNGSLVFNRSNDNTHSGAISGTGSLTKLGPGTLSLTNGAGNTYSGDTTISAGRISVSGTSEIGTGTLILDGGGLNTTATRNVTNEPIPNAINVTADSTITTTSAAATPQLNLTTTSVTGNGSKLTFRNDAPSGSGVFQPRFSSALTTNVPIEIANGAFGTTELSSFNTTATVQTFDGVISGNGSYVRNASSALTGGTTVFTAANTYSGGTTVARGTLVANNTAGSATGSGAVTVNSGGTLAGTGAIAGPVTINNGGTIAPGPSIESLNVGALTFNTGGKFDYEMNTDLSFAVAADLLNANGALSIATGALLNIVNLGSTQLFGGTKFTLISYAGAWDGGEFAGHPDDSLFVVGATQYQINYNDTVGGLNFSGGDFLNYVTITAVPEASTILFGGLVCLAIGFCHIRKKVLQRRATA